MRKPTRKSLRHLDWRQCTDYIERKYNIDTSDYAHSNTAFGDWCKSIGEKPRPLPPRCAANVMKAHQEQYARFNKAIADGTFKDRPYQNFWHWLIDVIDPSKGAPFMLYGCLALEAEPWQKKVLSIYRKEFGGGPYIAEW